MTPKSRSLLGISIAARQRTARLQADGVMLLWFCGRVYMHTQAGSQAGLVGVHVCSEGDNRLQGHPSWSEQLSVVHYD